mgnify:CR=1 FL=1
MKYIKHFLKHLRFFFMNPKFTVKWFLEDLRKDFKSNKYKSSCYKVWCAGLPKSGTTLIEEIFENLPYVLGNKDDFKKLYKNLEQLNFPFETVKKYTLFNSMRWDLETKSNQIKKLPIKYYSKCIENFLD